MEDILDFWFGTPARTSPELFAKIARWFVHGASLDAEIEARFGARLRRALRGGFVIGDDPRERLATILLLDQFPRHIFRGTRDMYAGDRAALQLAIDGLDRGMDASLDAEQRIFFAMPLAHAEDLSLQTRSAELARAYAREAPEPLREALEAGAARAAHYRDVIARFGRFPTRNAILGRRSTREEQEVLALGDTGPVVSRP